MDTAPLLFGSAENQALLLQLYRDGHWRPPEAHCIPAPLRKSGLLAQTRDSEGTALLIDPRHPAYARVYAVLADLARCAAGPVLVSPKRRSEYSIDTVRPLGHADIFAFRILRFIIASGGATPDSLRSFLGPISLVRIAASVRGLEDDGVVACEGSTIEIAPSVPGDYVALIADVASILEKRDKRLTMEIAPRVPVSASFGVGADRAPLLFGTDIRLRNLMALAKHGPMHRRDLKHLTGAADAKDESAGVAPFGRGGLVRTWRTATGPVVGLDPAHPLRLPLRRLLLKLEILYPLRPYVETQKIGLPAAPSKWNGDKQALFGGGIVTGILASIGVMGWTFEALCVATCVGYDRVVVKRALKRLETMGILVGERGRRPGSDVRVLRLADSCPARDELYALLKAYKDVWPAASERMRVAMEQLSPRTKEHLRRRGLIERETKAIARKRWKDRSGSESREECLRRYYAVATAHGRDLTSHDLRSVSATLYLHIRQCWGSFAAFRTEAALAPMYAGITTRPNLTLRESCVNRYRDLVSHVGYQPNTADLHRLDRRLYDWIRIQWGGFPQFCDDLGFSPRNRRRSMRSSNAVRAEECRREYLALRERTGRPPLVEEMQRLAPGLYSRICKLEGGASVFRTLVATPPGGAFTRTEATYRRGKGTCA